MSSSWTITDPETLLDLTDEAVAPPLHPGEMLRDHFMADMGLTVAEVAQAMGVPPTHVQALVDERAPVTGEDSVRLGHAFGMSEGFWMSLQTRFEVETAKRHLAGSLDELPVLIAA